ncbi:MAG: ATP cone domain-containing protein, partial [Lacunisphaera sp.]
MITSTAPTRPANRLFAATVPVDHLVVKRDGSAVTWDTGKVARAIALAFYDVAHDGAPNPHRDEVGARYGLDVSTFGRAHLIAGRVEHMVELFYRAGRRPSIEQVQDLAEKAIAAEGEWAVARSYIAYRERQRMHRLKKHGDNGLSDYIAMAKYARYRSDLGRRETFPEAVERVAAMHRDFFADRLNRPIAALEGVSEANRLLLAGCLTGETLGEAITRAFGAVAAKKVLPSMRSLQFGGTAVLGNHARLFNCSFSLADRVEFFREYFFLLLAGTGCGFSVQRQHVERLPAFP